MTPQISCPNCGQPVDAQVRYCPHCRADIAIAAELAEQELSLPGRLQAGVPVTPEILAPRLGDYLVEKGSLRQEDLEKALAYQAGRSAAGHATLLGQALRELGLISPEELDRAVTVQILHLQNALRNSNRELEARVEQRTLELQQAFGKLAELSQLKANFIANISHELRTPLTHLKGYLEILMSGNLGDMAPGQMDALNVMQRAESRLERLIEDLIQFALVSRGKLTLATQAVQVAPMLDAAIQQVGLRASKGGVRLEAQCPDDLPMVWCDAEKIGWVMAQLIDNAVKFTPKGGSVTIEVTERQTFVTIAVIDSGIGIPQDRIDEIFEPFHQLDGSATRRYGGTGLGLALSNQIIKAHDTQIRVQSIPGKGSRFEFDLAVSNERMEN